MSTLKEMLGMNGGSFQKAEQMALDFIAKGHTDVFLDLSLLFHAQGKIEGARQALDQYAKINPTCLLLKYAQKWFELHDGNLYAGFEHIETGRSIGILGTKAVALESPRWDGTTNIRDKTVVLVSEGGFGDQIMTARFAKHLNDMGVKVIVDCSSGLVSLFSRTPGATSVITNECQRRGPSPSPEVDGNISSGTNRRVHHDYHILSMNAFGFLNCTWDTLWTGQYIFPQEKLVEIWKRIIPKTPGVMNVGLRWAGNPKFENAQFRRFPLAPFFRLTELPNVNFWSLQRDDHEAILPEKVTDLEPFLSTWEMTTAAISRMDLVISSCTAIAHLAGAMNIPTFVIVPAMT